MAGETPKKLRLVGMDARVGPDCRPPAVDIADPSAGASKVGPAPTGLGPHLMLFLAAAAMAGGSVAYLKVVEVLP